MIDVGIRGESSSCTGRTIPIHAALFRDYQKHVIKVVPMKFGNGPRLGVFCSITHSVTLRSLHRRALVVSRLFGSDPGLKMEKHDDFTAWAVKNGLEINGIAPHRFPDRGLGIVAVERHEVGLVFAT
jgi:hypothetical protein